MTPEKRDPDALQRIRESYFAGYYSSESDPKAGDPLHVWEPEVKTPHDAVMRAFHRVVGWMRAEGFIR